MRLAAAKAFHEADCNQALKNALHAGPRQRIDYEVGQVVYFWRKGMEGAKKNGPRVLERALPSDSHLSTEHCLG